MMFDLEGEIKKWIRGLRSDPSFEDGDIVEIEDHIRDSIETSIDNGLSPQKAFINATSAFGQLDVMGTEMIKSRTTNMELPKSDFLAHNYANSTNLITSNIIMLSNYLKIALRTLRKNRGLSLINLFGMSIAFESIIIISNWP